MTAYQGGKKRIGKKIYEVICLVDEDLNPDTLLPYFEPFVGMASIMRHFAKDNDRELHGVDINKDLILLWRGIQRGWKPPLTCSESRYYELKNSNRHSAERGFIGIVGSFGCIFFHNYRLKNKNLEKKFLTEGYNGLMDIRPDIKKVKFEHGSYDDYECKGFLIYCDPPYKGNNLSSKIFTKFDHEVFWENMREWSKYNTVIISESTAPKDFEKIWSKDSHCTNQYKTKRYKDNLYIHKSLYDRLNKDTLKQIENIK